MTARNYGIDPNYAWQILGYGDLSPRQSRRLVRACNDLWARDNALDEVAQAKDNPKHKWRAETVLLIRDTEMTAARYGVVPADGELYGEPEDGASGQEIPE